MLRQMSTILYTPEEIIAAIVSNDAAVRNRSIEDLLAGHTAGQLLVIAGELESFRTGSDNLYHRVRASLFLFFLYRFCLIGHTEIEPLGRISYEGVCCSFERKFEDALRLFLLDLEHDGCNENICSALGDVYHKLAFEYLSIRAECRNTLFVGSCPYFDAAVVPGGDDAFRIWRPLRLKRSQGPTTA